MRWSAVRIFCLLLLVCRAAAAADEEPAQRQCPATALACSPDGQWLVTVGESELCVHDARSLAVVQRLILPVPFSCDVRFLSAVQLVVAGGTPGESGELIILHANDAATFRLETAQRLAAGSDVLSAAVRGADGLVAGGFDRALYRGLSTDENPRETIAAAHSKPITDVVSDATGKMLISCGADSTIRVWDSGSMTQQRALNNHARAVRGLALRPQTEAAALPLLASAADDRTVRFWQPTIGRMVRFKRLKSPATCVTWLDDGSNAVVGCRNGRVCFVDPVRLSLKQVTLSENGWVSCVDSVPDSSDVIAAATDGTLRRIAAGDARD